MHVSSWGYACFLTVNATSIWGGVFPFLPLEFQTAEITLTFFLAQALAFGGAFVASMLGSYYFCLLYTSPSPRDRQKSRMPSSA